MKKKEMFFILAFFISMTGYAQEADNDEKFDDINYDFGTAGEITVYGERPKEFDSKSIDAYVLNQINGSPSERKQFIETDFLEEAGFRRNGNVKYRKTNASEKALSVLHGIAGIVSLGLLPIHGKPFFEVEYDKLPRGNSYSFESVFVKSNYKNVTPEVLTVMELEYILQIEFRNGLIIQNSSYTNTSYYTDENINKFERLILELPDSPESIYQAKNRYLNELQKIKTAFERYKNPGENYLRAVQNMEDSFKK
jgi:hypothetical protein